MNVNGKDDIPYIMEKINMFQATNQYIIINPFTVKGHNCNPIKILGTLGQYTACDLLQAATTFGAATRSASGTRSVAEFTVRAGLSTHGVIAKHL